MYEEQESQEIELTACQEIKEKMDQVELEVVKNGGMNCGWDAADHKDFLRLRTKFQNKTVTVAFVTAMSRAVPMADEVEVREHCHAYENYLILQKEKKELILKYKEAKEEERISKLTKYDASKKTYKRLNSDLDLHLGARGSSASDARSAANKMSLEERITMKDQLREWKSKKHEEDNKVRLNRVMEDKKMQDKLKKKIVAEREAKRNMIEEYKFQKDMEKQRDQDAEKLEKKKIMKQF